MENLYLGHFLYAIIISKCSVLRMKFYLYIKTMIIKGIFGILKLKEPTRKKKYAMKRALYFGWVFSHPVYPL